MTSRTHVIVRVRKKTHAALKDTPLENFPEIRERPFVNGNDDVDSFSIQRI